MNNTNKNEEGTNQLNKPKVFPLRNTYTRTLSATPTLSESINQSSQATNPSQTDKEGVKLNTNAPAFVPKDKRSNTLENKENLSTTTTTTGQTTSGYTQPGQAYGMGGYPIQGAVPGKTGSYINFTYLGPQQMYPVGFSPNTRTGSFFPPTIQPMGAIPNSMSYPNYMGTYQKTQYQNVPQTMIPSGQTLPMQTLTNQQTVAPVTPATTTSLLGSDKKITFSKDSKTFVPKALRESKVITQPEEVVLKEEIKESKEKEPTVMSIPFSPKIEKEQVQTDHITNVKPMVEEKQEKIDILTTAAVENKNYPAQPETRAVVQPVVEVKKSKLKDFLEAPPEKKTLIASKNNTVNKKIIVVTPSVTVTQKDKDKAFEEKRKQLINLQKQQEKTKPNVSTTITKRPELQTVSTPPPKEEVESGSGIPSDEEEETVTDKEKIIKKNLTIDRFYFLKDQDQKKESKHTYTVDYINSFKNWKICRETKLLDDMLKDHIKAMSIWEDERPKGYKEKRKGKHQEPIPSSSSFSKGSVVVPEDKLDKSSFIRSTTKLDQPLTALSAIDLLKWGRKDMSAIEKEAAEYRQKFEEAKNKDPLKNELTECLNQLTVDNYEEVKQLIYEKVKNDVADQIKLLDVLFKKAVSERSFVTLYARLCKDLDKDVPQKSEKQKGGSQMRSELLSKCREVFKVDNVKINQYINLDNEEEREGKLKKFLLGNVNFIGELINIKLLSRRIVFQCIDNLLVRVENQDEQNLIKQINMEAIVILMDKFGTLINKYDTNIKPDDLADFNIKIDEYLNKLDKYQQNDKSLPGHVRYKIINLIEKRKRGWEESKVDKTTAAKGIKEVREEYEYEQRVIASGGRVLTSKLDQDSVNARIKQDMYAFKSHLKEGYPREEFQWIIIDLLTRKHKNTLGDILNGFGESCIDFVGREADIECAYLYFRDIITYFSQKIDRKEKMELLEVALFFLQNLSDFSLDNILLINVWGGVIYLLEILNIFRYSDIDSLKEVQEDQVKTIFEVMNTALKYYDIKEEKLKELSNTNMVKANKSLFDSIVNF